MLRISTIVQLLVCATIVATAAPAFAQGKGLGAGKLKFHPALTIETGYDSNVFYEDAAESPVDAPMVSVRPRFGVNVDNPTNFDIKLESGISYNQYISDNNAIQNQSGLESDVNGRLTFNPAGAVAFALSDVLVRTHESPSVDSLSSINRLYNKAGANLIIQPGGKVLTLDLGGSYEILSYDGDYDDLDRKALGLNAEIKWKFLPKTALIVVGSQDFVGYDEAVRQFDSAGAPAAWEGTDVARNVDSRPLRVMGGLAGLVGNRVSVTALAGYGNGFYDEGENFSGVIGRGELGYEIGPTSRARIGYERNFIDSSFSNVATLQKGFLRYNQQFSGFFQLNLEGALKYYEFATVTNATPGTTVNGSTDGYSTVDRKDPIATGLVEGVFIFAEIWRVGTKYQLESNFSDFEINHGSPIPGPSPDDIYEQGLARVSYVKHRFMLTAGVEW